MEKRLPLFLFLSLLILFGWQLLNPRPPVPPATPAGSAQEGAPAPAGEPQAVAPPAAELAATEERTETLFLGRAGEPGHYRVRVTNRGARILSLDLDGYYNRIGLSDEEKRDPESWVRLLEPVRTQDGELGSLVLSTRPSSADLAPAGLDSVLWTQEVLGDAAAPTGVEWRYGPGRGIVFVKRLLRSGDGYRLRLELAIENQGELPARPAELLLVPAGCVPPALGDQFYAEPRAIAIGYDEDDEQHRAEWESAASSDGETGTLDVPEPLVVAGVHNKYFGFLLFGADDAGRAALAGASYRGVRDADRLAEQPDDAQDALRYVALDLNLALALPAPGTARTWAFEIFAGPKDIEVLESTHPAFLALERTDLSGFAMFSSIGGFLLGVLRFFHGLVGNWGVAIILMTLCVRLVLFPLNRRSQTAMARYQTKMKRVQPRLEEVKKRHEGNPQKLREEQARIMQEERAFPPLGGCLPPFLQIPIFFGLFAALRTSFDLRHAPFALWIDDLSLPDRLFEINLHLPLYGELPYFNLLPILMVVLWIGQQMGMPKPTDEQAARMQKMMMFMPIFMGVWLYNYAAGLSLYMITSSACGIVEQRLIKKIWPLDDREPERKQPRGCGPFTGALQRLAEKQQEEMRRVQSGQSRSAAARDAARAEKKKKRRI